MAIAREKIRGFSKNENFNTSSSQAQTGTGAKMRAPKTSDNPPSPRNPIEPDGGFSIADDLTNAPNYGII